MKLHNDNKSSSAHTEAVLEIILNIQNDPSSLMMGLIYSSEVHLLSHKAAIIVSNI
jgi:hypothetical protein